MRIIQIVGSVEAEAAGPSYSVPRLASSLVDAGHDCTLMSLGTPGFDNIMGVRHRRCAKSFSNISSLNKLGASSEMRLELNSLARETDIMHTHGLWRMPNVYPATAAHFSQTRVVLSPRGMLSESALQYSVYSKRLFWIFIQRRALERVALFHATSEQEFEDIRRAGLRQPVAIVPNGIDLPELQEPISVDNGSLRKILYLGRLHPIKRVDTLIEAWAELEAEFPNWCLVVRGPGDPEYREKLKKLSRDLRVNRCEIGDAAYGEDKIQAFSEASFYVLPSASENFAMTVAESLACGTPVIATWGSPWKGLRDHRCGWWIDHGKQSLCVTLREAMSCSDDKLNGMGMIGRNWMRREFDWRGIGQKMASAYEWLLCGGKAPSFIQF